MTSEVEAAARSEDEVLRGLAADPRYQALVAHRARVTWALTGVILLVFFGYILLVAFSRELLARPIAGGTTTLGIPLGLGVIVATIVLTGIYVRWANQVLDREVRALRESVER